MDSLFNKMVNQTTSEVVALAAENARQIIRGSNLDSSVAAVGSVFTAATSYAAWAGWIISMPYILIVLAVLDGFYFELTQQAQNSRKTFKCWGAQAGVLDRLTFGLELRRQRQMSLLRERWYGPACRRGTRIYMSTLRQQVELSAIRGSMLPGAINNVQSLSDFRVMLEKALARNREMHSLNGNIEAYIESLEEVTSKAREQSYLMAEYRSPPSHEIGNVPVVPTEYLFAAKMAEAGNRLGPNTFSRNQLETKFSNFNLVAKDRFLKTAPKNSGAVPSEVVEVSSYPVCAPRAAHPVKDNYLAPAQRNNLGGAALLRPEYAPIGTMFSPNFSVADLVAADASMASNRFTGLRGNRQVQGWEASGITRVNNLRNIAHVDSQGQSYYRAAFRLWSAYLDASLASEFTADMVQEHPVVDADLVYDAAGAQSHMRLQLIPLSSYAAPGAAGAVASPENGLFDPPAPMTFDENLDMLESGTAAFIDAAQLGAEHVKWLIWALAPADPRFSWSWEDNIDGRGVVRRSTFLSNYREDPSGAIGGARRIFVHLGNRACPTQARYEAEMLGRADAAAPAIGVSPIRSPWSLRPSRSAIRAVLLHLIAKHHAGRDVWDALDSVLYRMHQLKADSLLAAAPNAPRDLCLNSFGNDDYVMPHDFTATAYLDVFRSPTDMAEDANEVMAFLDLPARDFTWIGVLACHANMAAANWAAYTFSLMGREWAVWDRVNKDVAANTPQYRRNIVTQMLQRLSDTDLNPWAVMHASATGHMYHFRPIDRTLSTTHMAMAGVWYAATPFMANVYQQMWMLKLMPLHMLLPLSQSTPSWPEDQPISLNPSADRNEYHVRLARSLPLFSGRAWIQDGGMMANAQHYAAMWTRAQGRPGGNFNARTPGLEIGSWTSPFQYEWPRNPTTFQPTYFGPAGTTFGNYLLPGSIWNYTTDNNRVKAVGVRIAPGTGGVIADASWDRWTRMMAGREQGTVSIGYIPPSNYRIERPPVNDFSLLIWGNKISSAYEGMSFASAAPRDQLPPPPDFVGVAEPGVRLPAALANHNDPHVPKLGMASKQYRAGPISKGVSDRLRIIESEKAKAEERAKWQEEWEAARGKPLVHGVSQPDVEAGGTMGVHMPQPVRRALNYSDPSFEVPRASAPSKWQQSGTVFDGWDYPSETQDQNRSGTPSFDDLVAAGEALRARKVQTKRARVPGRGDVFLSSSATIPNPVETAAPRQRYPSAEWRSPEREQRTLPRAAPNMQRTLSGTANQGVVYESKNPVGYTGVRDRISALGGSGSSVPYKPTFRPASPARYLDGNVAHGTYQAQAPNDVPVYQGRAIIAGKGVSTAPIVEAANDALAGATQAAIARSSQVPIPPAPQLNASGDGNAHFPGADAQVFEAVAAHIAPTPSGGDNPEN